jgi:hypothetical protein
MYDSARVVRRTRHLSVVTDPLSPLFLVLVSVPVPPTSPRVPVRCQQELEEFETRKRERAEVHTFHHNFFSVGPYLECTRFPSFALDRPWADFKHKCGSILDLTETPLHDLGASEPQTDLRRISD